MLTIAETFALAERAHRGVPDKAGNPYIHHPRAVAALLAPYGYLAVVAGLLHDVVEDTEHTLADLRALGYPELILSTVESVSWAHKDETYDELVARAAAHPLGRHLKLADNTHNTWPGRVATLAAVDPDKATKQAVKYARARATLVAAGATLTPPFAMFSWDDNPLPCPVLSEQGYWCARPIPNGGAVKDGHPGEHAWVSPADPVAPYLAVAQ